MSTKRQKRAKKLQAQEETSSRLTLESLVGLFVIAFLFFLWGSWLLPITDPVESNYALTAKEMVMSGNWISPQIYGVFWYDKPIMVYWLLSISYSLFGFTDLASRIPAAFCGALSTTLLIWYVRRILKDNVIAMWSGCMLAVSLEFWVISHAIITDSILLLFTIPTLLSAYIGITENSKKHLTIAYVAAGLACLTKGPVGLVLPGILLVLWCLSMKSPKTILRLFPWQGLLAFFVVVLPWYGGMYLIHGSDFINEFLGLHNVLRATSSEHPEDNHIYYYLVLLPASLLPWAFLSFYEMWKGWKERTNFYRFLMVWCWGTILFYTLMATKYVTYTYIAVVPAIILAAFAAPKMRLGDKITALWGGLGLLLLMIACTAGTFYIKEGNWWIFYLVLAYGLFAYLIRWKANQYKRLTIITCVTASMLLCLMMEGLPRYLPTRSTLELDEALHAAPGEHYFFQSYPASYTYYTGETATRLVPTLHEKEENRDARWNDKYAMPSVSDTEFIESHENPSEPVFLYVAKNKQKLFDQWLLRHRFVLTKKLVSGNIYVLVNKDQLEAHS